MTAPSPLQQLWQHVYGELTGYICIAFGTRTEPNQKRLDDFQERFYPYPAAAGMAEGILEQQADRPRRETYICAHLLTEKKRQKQTAAQVHALYVDGDGATVPNTIPPPTAVIESSPGREQFYWRLSHPIAPKRAEDLNRRLAYAMDADLSGWDLTQLLRPPGFPNRKRETDSAVRLVSITSDIAYDPDELERTLPLAPTRTSHRARSTGAAPPVDGDEPPVRLRGRALEVWRGQHPVYGEGGAIDRSKSLWPIAKDLYRAGASVPTIAAALAERDVTLDYHKASGRTDGGAAWYQAMAEDAALAVEKEWADDQTTEGGDEPACREHLAEARRHIMRLEAQNARLQAENERLQQQRDTYRGLARRRGQLYAQALRRIRVQQQLSDNPYFDGRVTVVRAFAHEVAQAGPEDRRADGKYRVRRWRMAKTSTKSEDTVSKFIDSLKKAELVSTEYVETPAAPGKPPRTELYVDLPGLTLPETADLETRTLAVEEYLAVRAPVRKRTGKLGQTHGGPRPTCRRCGPDAVIEETITRQHRCRSCDTLLESHTRTVTRYRNDGHAALRLAAEAGTQDASPSPAVDADPWHDDPAEASAPPPGTQDAAQDPIEDTGTQDASRPFAWFPRPDIAARLTADELKDALRWVDEQRGHRRVITRDGLGTVVDFDIPLWRVKVRVGDADRWYSLDHPADPPETGGAHVAA